RCEQNSLHFLDISSQWQANCVKPLKIITCGSIYCIITRWRICSCGESLHALLCLYVHSLSMDCVKNRPGRQSVCAVPPWRSRSMATSVNSVFSTRNREKFVHEGHMYTYDGLNGSRTIKFWRCDRRYMYRCKARLHTRVDTGELVRMPNDHNHDSDAAHLGATVVRSAAMHRAEVTMKAPSGTRYSRCRKATAAHELCHEAVYSPKEESRGSCSATAYQRGFHDYTRSLRKESP
ncbi:hypothetical protein M514_12516, partial [Trichuris suis]